MSSTHPLNRQSLGTGCAPGTRVIEVVTTPFRLVHRRFLVFLFCSVFNYFKKSRSARAPFHFFLTYVMEEGSETSTMTHFLCLKWQRLWLKLTFSTIKGSTCCLKSTSQHHGRLWVKIFFFFCFCFYHFNHLKCIAQGHLHMFTLLCHQHHHLYTGLPPTSKPCTH